MKNLSILILITLLSACQKPTEPAEYNFTPVPEVKGNPTPHFELAQHWERSPEDANSLLNEGKLLQYYPHPEQDSGLSPLELAEQKAVDFESAQTYEIILVDTPIAVLQTTHQILLDTPIYFLTFLQDGQLHLIYVEGGELKESYPAIERIIQTLEWR